MRYVLGLGVACLLLCVQAVSCAGPPISATPQRDAVCTRYVDNRAPSDGDGSESHPWTGIAAHVDDLAPGDTMCVRGDPAAPGRVYDEPGITLGRHSGTEGAPITIRTYPGERVVLRSPGDRSIVEFRGVSHWHLEGFNLDKQGQGGYAIRFVRADRNVVRNCEVYNGSYEGIHFDSGDANLIKGCRIHNFDAGPGADGQCILLAGGIGNVIHSNTIYDCTGDGIHLYPQQELSGTVIEYNHIYTNLGPCSENAIDVKIGGDQTTLIHGNTMHGFRPCDGSCGGTGGGIGEAVVIHREARNVTLDANTVYDCGTGIRVLAGSNIRITNNLIRDLVDLPGFWAGFGIQASGGSIVAHHNTMVNLPRDLLLVGSGASIDLRNNLFYRTGSVRLEGGSVSADYNGWFSAAQTIPGPNDIVGSDPGFVSADDYRLGPGSPAINAGERSLTPLTDFAGNARPADGGVDLGAFQSQGATPATLPAP